MKKILFSASRPMAAVLSMLLMLLALAVPMMEVRFGWNWPNEVVLVYELLVFFSLATGVFRFFGAKGLMAFSVLATVLANIECLISIDAFGIGMTGGNILFAITFLCTDIVSELYGKKQANRVVYLGVAISLVFLVVSQSWLMSKPNEADFVFPSIKRIFSNTPRVMLASLLTYAVVQQFDIWLYHRIWKATEAKKGRKAFLWLRNNGSTLTSQWFNSVMFTLAAFYDPKAEAWNPDCFGSLAWCGMVVVSTYAVYIVTSLCDTPFLYLCRRMKEKGLVHEIEL